MSDDEPRAGASAATEGKDSRREQRDRRRRVLRIVAWVSAGLVLLAGAGAGYLYFKLDGNITSVDIDGAARHRPALALDNGSMDILVLGSDSPVRARTASTAHDGGNARSDTAMIVHLDKGRKSASVVSIPRDTLVNRPACAQHPRAATAPAEQRAMFNSAYEAGGPACAVKTVETADRAAHGPLHRGRLHRLQEPGRRPGRGPGHHHRRPIHDPKSHLNLAPARHTLDGEQALGLVRTRHGVGDGSDLGRIQLQQAFLKALMDRVQRPRAAVQPHEAVHASPTPPPSAVTTDSGLGSVTKLMGLAESVQRPGVAAMSTW